MADSLLYILPEIRKFHQLSFLVLGDALMYLNDDDVAVVAAVGDWSKRKEIKISVFVFEHHILSRCSGCDPRILKHGMDWDLFVAADVVALVLEA